MPGAMQFYGTPTVSALLKPGETDRKDGLQQMRASCNAGLVWERYLPLWNRSTRISGEELRSALQVFADDFNGRKDTAAVCKLLNIAHERQRRLLAAKLDAGETLELKLETPFITGTGIPHPTEIGFAFERSIGVPYLPGSAVKGLARAAASVTEMSSAEQDLLFGPDPDPNDRESNRAIGDLVFLDAFPASWPTLKVDIINCHHSSYYVGRSDYPSETEDPVPVYFVSMAEGSAWVFRLFSRTARKSNAAEGKRVLACGLQNLGAGGKTAVGYGYFSR